MTNNSMYVDPFIGTEAIDLPEPDGIAATWFYLKAQVANNHPGAALPFSPVTALPYSGGYPTGYGVYDANTHGTPPEHYDRKRAFGVTHVHHSGTGYINYFYNYLLVAPFAGDRPVVPPVDLCAAVPYPLSREKAHPGYYSGLLEDIGVELELTAAPHATAHRYRLPAEGGLTIDVTNGGLAPKRAQYRPDQASVHIRDNSEVTGSFTFHGVRWCFAAICPGGAAPVAWQGETSAVEELQATRSLELNAAECEARRAGVVFRGGGTMELYIGLSVDGEAAALDYARKAADAGFDRVHDEARGLWESHLGRVQVGGGSERSRRLFYTALYHSLLKPVRSESANFLWRDGPALYSDFATMWDQYKTQVPLVFTLCPEHIMPVVESLKRQADITGEYPPAVLFADDFERFSNQSRLLPFVILRDAFDRIDPSDLGGYEADFWGGVVESMAAMIPDAAARVRPGEDTNGYSHLLDISYAAHCAAGIARSLGRSADVERASRFLDLWKEAFDPSTWMMRPGKYYEAAHVHYSFRLLHAMTERIRLAGGAEEFIRRLNEYFGYNAPPIRQLGDPPWDEERRRGMNLGRFDGLNNEVMLETPYAYHYVGRPDRTAEVVQAVMRYHFNDRAGGLPGNDDSGALSSWYVWSAVGLYPVPGQGIFLTGVPMFREVELVLGDRAFTVSATPDGHGAGDGAPGEIVYPSSVLLNGEPLDRSYLSYREVLRGGRLAVKTGGDAFRPSILPGGLETGGSQ